jgi:MFS transporter, DHA2 family, multidrug resistance protein
MTSAMPASTPAGRRLVTVALMTATAMQAADATIANVALPQLERDLGGGLALGAWVMTSYLCAAAVAVPLTGWLRRRFGPRDLYTAAIGLFVIGSLLCAMAPSAGAIIGFRIIQGAGGGVLPALSQAVLLDLHPRERHGRILAIWGAVAMLGPIMGPVLGGVATDLASWRLAFAINAPLGLLAILGARRSLPERERGRPAPFDGIGLVLLIMGIGALQLCLERGVGRSWLDSPELVGEASIALIALSVTAARTRYGGQTILRVDVFKDMNFAAAAFLNFATSALLFTAIVFLPVLAQGPLGYPATVAGLSIVPRGVLMMLMVLAVGPLIGRIDHRVVLVTGSMLIAGGLVLLTRIRPTDGLALVVLGSTVQAMGAGTVLVVLNTVAYATLPAEMRTDAAGLFSLLRQIGCASGVALMTSVLQQRGAVHAARLASEIAGAGGRLPAPLAAIASLQAYADCFRIMAVATVVVVPAIFLFRPARTEPAIDTIDHAA